MNLLKYINVFYQGNKAAFARDIGIQQPNVYPLINRGAAIFGNRIYTSSKKLPPHTDWPSYASRERFEDMVRDKMAGSGKEPNFQLDEKGGYVDQWMRGAFAGWKLAMEMSAAVGESKADSISDKITDMESHLRALKNEINADDPEDSYF